MPASISPVRTPEASFLPAASGAVSDKAVLDWAMSTAAMVRSSLDRTTTCISVRAYRHCGDHLSMDFHDAPGSQLSINFHADGLYGLAEYECGVPDVVEALHLIGLVATLLDQPVRIGEPFDMVRVRSA